MSEEYIPGLWPIAVFEDRYGGTYSGGKWLAVAAFECGCSEMDDLTEDDRTKLDYAANRALSGDFEAGEFGGKIAEIRWLSVGETPDEAIKNLREKARANLVG